MLADTFPKLMKLYLANILTDEADTNGEQLASLMEAISTHSRFVNELDLSENTLTPQGAKATGVALSQLIGKKTQFTLQLNETKLGDEGITAFTHGVRQTYKISSLWIQGNDIHTKGLSTLMSSLSTGVLVVHTLKLDNNPLDYKGSMKIIETLSNENCSLKKLSLRNCTLTSFPSVESKSHGTPSLQCLSHLTPSNTVQRLHLDLTDNNFGGDCVYVLADYIFMCRSLTHLTCCSCSLNSDDMIHLLDQLIYLKSVQSTSLHSLKLYIWELSDNSIDDEGVAVLIENMSFLFPSLEEVSLYGNQVSDGMFWRLNEILQLHKEVIPSFIRISRYLSKRE